MCWLSSLATDHLCCCCALAGEAVSILHSKCLPLCVHGRIGLCKVSFFFLERKRPKCGNIPIPCIVRSNERPQVTLGHVVDRKMREMGYIRKPPVDELKNRRSLRDRVAAEDAPEVRTGVERLPVALEFSDRFKETARQPPE